MINKKLKWVKIKDGNKTLLICDRNILNNISWDTLNETGYVDGTKITIDGNDYLCRLLTGGNNYRSGTDEYSGVLLQIMNGIDLYGMKMV